MYAVINVLIFNLPSVFRQARRKVLMSPHRAKSRPVFVAYRFDAPFSQRCEVAAVAFLHKLDVGVSTQA
jgi:hypothetical protein